MSSSRVADCCTGLGLGAGGASSGSMETGWLVVCDEVPVLPGVVLGAGAVVARLGLCVEEGLGVF